MDSVRAISTAVGPAVLIGIGCVGIRKGQTLKAKASGAGWLVFGIAIVVVVFGLPPSEQETKRQEARKVAARLEARWDVIDEARTRLPAVRASRMCCASNARATTGFATAGIALWNPA